MQIRFNRSKSFHPLCAAAQRQPQSRRPAAERASTRRSFDASRPDGVARADMRGRSAAGWTSLGTLATATASRARALAASCLPPAVATRSRALVDACLPPALASRAQALLPEDTLAVAGVAASSLGIAVAHASVRAGVLACGLLGYGVAAWGVLLAIEWYVRHCPDYSGEPLRVTAATHRMLRRISLPLAGRVGALDGRLVEPLLACSRRSGVGEAAPPEQRRALGLGLAGTGGLIWGAGAAVASVGALGFVSSLGAPLGFWCSLLGARLLFEPEAPAPDASPCARRPMPKWPVGRLAHAAQLYRQGHLDPATG